MGTTLIPKPTTTHTEKNQSENKNAPINLCLHAHFS